MNPLESISAKKFTFSTMSKRYNLSFLAFSVHTDYSSPKTDGLRLTWSVISPKERNAELEHFEFYTVICVFQDFQYNYKFHDFSSNENHSLTFPGILEAKRSLHTVELLFTNSKIYNGLIF